MSAMGVVLIAPFTSGWRLIFKRHATASPCCLDRFQSYERASDIDVPVLICHGMDDETIPVSHGEAMYARMRHAVAPLYVPGADHESIFSGRYPVVFQRIRHFLHHQIDFL
ncbi:Alpha/beta hydrolase domain-containing protein 17A [Toxocara canis]|uniref:Alpha/beta hydrolase domain-containing protein 17A n=1 Tax=Toxocara canis TaxID=6265 RepID=A0A0B2VJ20_TOXCA|nr:Alpha/beta hydrolase domain-containing protein 17A [Toxocara canis]